MAQFVIHNGDSIEMMRTIPDGTVDAVVTDPPYHLTNASGGPAKGNDNAYSRSRAGASSKGFMGEEWDGGDIAQRVELWAEVFRVLKPGGHLLTFGGTRTQHRMVCAIEDAGFEIRDQIGWVYGSGFPKSRNIAAQDMAGQDAINWAGWGTALKPAWEPICVARKPLIGTVAANVLAYGTGALNIEACKIDVEDDQYARNCSGDRGHVGSNRGMEFRMKAGQAGSGRWPANLIHDGSDEVLAQFPDASGQKGAVRGDEPSAQLGTVYEGTFDRRRASAPRGDGGSAARFFYVPKASRTDRNEGLPAGGGPVVSSGATMREREIADWESRNGNYHPTVKPTELMGYLVRLVTPPGGTVLDPFMGSGSTGKACMREGMQFIGIELELEYVMIAGARIEHELAMIDAANAPPPPDPQLDLFAESSV